MPTIESIGALLAPWSDYYAAHIAVQSGLLFAHFAGMLAGGGVAFATDRDTFRARRGSDADRQRQVKRLNAAHRIVIGGLAVTFLSGLLLLAADFEALIVVPAFWVKMGLLALLMANGAVRARAGHRATESSPRGARAWRTINRAAIASAVLWFAVVASGVIMTGSA